MGIRYFVFAVNKMDLVYYDNNRFAKIEKEIKRFISEFPINDVQIIPVSATEGDNINKKSSAMYWYKGETLLEYLENVEIDDLMKSDDFILPVQRVCRPKHTFRGFQGQIEAGEISVGDEVYILPSKEKANISAIYVADKEEKIAQAGQPVTIQMNREVDVSRGCVISKSLKVQLTNMFTAQVLWMDESPLVQGRNYWIRIGTKMTSASVMKIKYKIDVNSGEHIPDKQIYKNELAVCDVMLAEKCALTEFEQNRSQGAFIFIDRISNMTSACGTVTHTLRRADNLTWHEATVTKEMRSKLKNQEAKTIWFTGLSGSGKSTLANALESRLIAMGKHTMLLDGDNIRMGLNKNLGFQETDRVENIRRIAEVAKLMNDAGLIVLTAFISPYEKDRQNARNIIGDDFFEVYVSTSLEECEKRDVKGLYKKARNGEIPNFTGISSSYEIPERPDIILDTEKLSVDDSVNMLIEALKI